MEPTSKSKKKKFPLLLTLGTTGLLIAGGGAAYWFLARQGGPGTLPTGANVIPQDAMIVVSVSTNEGQWQQLREFGTPQTQASFDQSLAQLRDRFLGVQGFNYQQDIQPWIGSEVTLAFLGNQPGTTPPPSPAPGTLPAPSLGQQQTILAVLPIRDPLKAKQLLEKPRNAGPIKWTERTYKGFQIRESQGSPTQNYSVTALDGRFLVLTNSPQATDKAIDTYKGGPALPATPGYTDALGKIQAPQPFARLYVNIPTAATATAGGGARQLSPEGLARLQQNQGLAGTAILEPEGIRFRSVSWLKPNSERRYEVRNTAKTMPDRLPAETILMASGGSLKRLWQDYTQGLSANPIGFINPEGLRRGIKSSVDLDLDQDVLAWMDGEFTLGLVSAPPGSPPNLPAGLVFMVQASDRRAAEKTLKQLDQVMASKYSFKVEEGKIASQSVVNWTLPPGNTVITRGWLDGDVAFLTLGAPVSSTLVPRPTNSLSQTDLYKKTITGDLNPNNGHFFANLERAASSNLPLFQFPPGNRALSEAIRSIGVTAAIATDRSTRYDLFVMLRKGNKPGPLPSPVPNPALPPASPSPAP